MSTFRADSLATGPRNTHSTTRGRSLQSEIEVRFARIMSRATIPPRISLLPRPSACHVSIVRSKHVSFELLLFVFPRFPLPPYFFYFFLFSSPPPRGRGRIVLWEKFLIHDGEAASNRLSNRNWSAGFLSLPRPLLSSSTTESRVLSAEFQIRRLPG